VFPDNCGLPGQRFAEMEIATRRPVGRKPGELDAGLPSVGNLEFCVWATHIGLHPAGVRGIDLDRGLAQLMREMKREAFNAVFDVS
jgi:hypothetical protein